ncbi:MAG: bifunctional DNA primase/polymerase [Myxococcota bacterium]
MSTHAQLANAYHIAGYRIHPCKPRDKRPMLDGWPEHCYRDAAEVEAQWLRLPNGNIGLITGPHADAPVALVAFDCDGPAFLQRALSILPPTPARTISGSGKGGHLIYRWRSDAPCPKKYTIAKGEAGAHEELAFYGVGGQVVLPGSIHPETGEPYRWAHAPDDPFAIPPANTLPIIGPEALTALAPPTPAPVVDWPPRNRAASAPAGATVQRLLAACEAANLSPRPLSGDKWAIACPWRQEHGGGAQGESDTVILAGRDGAPWFKCLHGHCSDRHIADLCTVLARYLPTDAADPGGVEPNKREPGQHTRLLRLTQPLCDVFCTPEGKCFADVRRNGHRETMPIRCDTFKHWLVGTYYDSTGEAPSAEARERVLCTYEAAAHRGGALHTVFLRVASHGGALYLDLGDNSWRAVEVDADGWRVVDAPPVRFRRSRPMLALPTPTRNGSLDDLRPFLNTASEADWILAVAWLLAALRPAGPFPVLVLSGEQGTAKSSAARFLRGLVDPNSAPVRCVPREDRDMAIAADNIHILAFDNVSSLPAWLSDALCRLATGGGVAVRALYTGRDEEVFEAQRPIILNGIPDFVSRGDLASRAVRLCLEPIPEDRRRPESDLLPEFEAVRPGILGALLDAVAVGLGRLPTMQRPARLPRLADFALWVQACEPGLWPEGDFGHAFDGNHADAVAATLEADPVAQVALTLGRREDDGWTGTASEFLSIAKGMNPGAFDGRHTPTPRDLSERLRRAAPLLRESGVAVIRDRSKGKDRTRLIVLCATDKAGEPPPGVADDLFTAAE